MRLALVVCFLFASLSGCDKERGGGLLLTIDSVDAIATSMITLTVEGAKRSKQIEVPVTSGNLPPAIEIGIEFPPDALGAVSITAATNSKTVAGSTTIVADQTASLTLKFPGASTNELLVSDPTEIPFGEVATGSKSPAILLTVTNTGSMASSALVVSSSNAAFVVSNDNCAGNSIASGASCTMRIEFVPVATGEVSGLINVGGLTVAVSGTGVTPGALVSADSPYDFGTISVTDTALKTFTVRNSGSVASGSIVVESIGGADPSMFAKTNDSCDGGAIGPDETCAIEIRYNPSVVGSHAATIKVSSAKAGQLTLSWTAESRESTLSINPSSKDFGAVLVDDVSLDQEFVVTNNAAIAIGPIALSVSAPFVLQPGGTCVGATIAPDATCTVVARFAPTSMGVFTDQKLTLLAPNLPTSAEVSLSGSAFDCLDTDGDGIFVKAGASGDCGTPDDCDDTDTDNWDKCATCLDTDGDGFFAGCNRYTTRYSECDADANDAQRLPAAERIGDPDLDCDGQVVAVDDTHGIFVAPTGNPANAGTAAAPLSTIADALNKLSFTKKSIFIQKGTYPESILLSAAKKNVGVFGGFDVAWARNLSTNDVHITTGTNFGAAASAAVSVRLDGLRFEPTSFDGASFSGGARVLIQDSTVNCGTGKSALLAKDLHTIVTATDTVFVCSGQSASSTSIRVSEAATVDLVRGSVSNGTNTNGTTSIGIDVNAASLDVTGTSVSASSPTNRRSVVVGGVSSVALIESANLTVSSGSGSTCWSVLQSAGSVTIQNSKLSTCSSLSSRAVNATGGDALVFLNNFINGSGQPSNNGAISVQSVTKTIIANNYIKQVGGTGTTGVLVLNLPASNIFELVNNIIEVGTDSNGVTLSGTGGTVNLRNNSITGGACALYSGACAGSVNSCSGVSRCGVASGNLTVVCDRDGTDHLTATSACKSAGVDPRLSSTGTTVLTSSFNDMDGVLRPVGTWDIGPDEVSN